jgi:hypothetical protein
VVDLEPGELLAEERGVLVGHRADPRHLALAVLDAVPASHQSTRRADAATGAGQPPPGSTR